MAVIITRLFAYSQGSLDSFHIERNDAIVIDGVIVYVDQVGFEGEAVIASEDVYCALPLKFMENAFISIDFLSTFIVALLTKTGMLATNTGFRLPASS